MVRPTEDAVVRLEAGPEAQDDCAVFSFDGRQDLVVGSDYVRGPKFRLYEYGLLDEFDLGYYLIAANVSDVAAMGAHPIGVLTVIRYPASMDDEVFAKVLAGIRAACDEFNAPNVGGDIGGAERLILSATALGVCGPGRALTRHGAQPGDVLCLTGTTGMAGAAMQYYRSKTRSPEIDEKYHDTLLNSWRRPVARVDEGVILGQSGLATSCQDTSDGLKAAIESLAVASSVGFDVDESRIVVDPEVKAVCDLLGLDTMEAIMGDSVDFQLAFTVRPEGLSELQSSFADADRILLPIGVATRNTGTASLKRLDGRISALPGRAWRHAPDPAVRPGG